MRPFSIHQLVEDQKKRDSLVNDCVAIIDHEVRSKSGLSGIAIKSAYRVLCKVTPNALYQAMDYLIDDFALQIEPHLNEFRVNKTVGSLPRFLGARASSLADSLLQTTDDKAHSFDSSAISTLYRALRPQAKKHVEDAVPQIAAVLEKHLNDAQLVTPAGIEPASAT